MSAIDKVRNHFNKAVENNLQKYHCAKWDMDIYFYPTYPIKDEMRIMNLQGQGKSMEALVESLLVKARDGDGKRLFNDADRATLLNEADPKVVIQVAGVINAGIMSNEDLEKN